MKLRIGTRGSHLARTQAAGVAGELAELGHDAELCIISTAGDRSTATSFGSIGPQGVFVREIEHALLAGEVDIAIHSYKDLPTQSPDDLTIGAVPERLDPADVLVMTRAAAADSAEALPIAGGARVGTASARRQAWIRHLRPDISVVPIRGNVPTRISRLRADLDGVVLAAAGIQRLRRSPLDGVTDPVPVEFVVRRLQPVNFVPAPAQGALAIQCRRTDEGLRKLLKSLDHAVTRQAVAVERYLLARVEGGCDLAFGAWCTADESWARQTRDPASFNGAPQASSNNAERAPYMRLARLVAWLEHDGVLHKANTQATDANSLVDAAWAELERQWTG
ncbi:MAG: hydroxymethylbilane synthase [Rhodospirillaceae bacterium]|nr:hydroxymethylbilane synthase [Rhodospirillaceae bacterium]